MDCNGSIIPNQYSYTWQPLTPIETETVETVEYDADGRVTKKTVTTRYKSNQPSRGYEVWCAA